MGKDRHLTEADAEYHKTVSTLDNGACLSGACAPTYQEDHSCSYRWQAVKFSRSNKERRDLYNKNVVITRKTAKRYQKDHGISGNFIPTSRYPTNSGGVYPPPDAYGDKLRVPRTHDWAVDGPKQAGAVDSLGNEIELGRNFERVYWPYWNNAHHMIPKGTLSAMIETVADDARLANLIRAGLLKGLYNVNHYKNMILLPMDKEVGLHLQLPRHLSLDDESDEFDPHPKFNHVAYNGKVEKRLDSILQDYMEKAQQVKQGEVKCEMKEMSSLSKVKLEKLSKDCYDTIISFGKKKPGRPLVDLPDLSEP